MSEKSAKSFLSLLQRSGIASDDQLKKALSALKKKAAGRKVKIDELTEHLITSGIITNWHYDKLINGKYKGFFLGKYKLLGHLGTGGMSSVYLAEHSITGHKRALKVLPKKKVADKSYLDRFYREGRAAAALNDPNIVRVYDICQEGDTHYLVMEYVVGQDLYEMVKANGKIEIERALDYISQAAKGLHHAHQRKLVHRDIKPANLLLSDGDNIKILDLGLALFADDEESLTVLHNEKVMGTADYLSPEQAVNSHDVDHRADIYSLGCTLYFLLTGHPPFPKGSLAQRIAMHQTKDPESILVDCPECPANIVELCQKMMRKSPAERYQTAQEVYQALQQCRQAIGASVSSSGISGLSSSELSSSGLSSLSGSGLSGSGASPSGSQPVLENPLSQAEIGTSKLAGNTNEQSLPPKPVSEFDIDTGLEAKPLATPDTKARIAKIEPKRKSQLNLALWFGLMIGAMALLLLLVLIVLFNFVT